MDDLEIHYFPTADEWREWLHENHMQEGGMFLIFYAVDHEKESMRWEEAVRVALCYGWIDSKVKSLGDGKRKQYYCQRKPKSVWSRINKDYIGELETAGLMHESGLEAVRIAKENGSWTELDDVENGVIPDDLQARFEENRDAFENFQNFTQSQRKGYLYWLHSAKRTTTRHKRIAEIVRLSEEDQKYRD